MTLSCIFSITMVAGTAWAEGSPEDARVHFQRGRELEAAGNLMGALAEYQTAMELRPTFRLHRHMGRVCRGMGRYREALEHFQTFLREGEGSLNAAEGGETQEALTEVRRNLASVQVVATQGASVFVDGVRVGNTPLNEAILVDPGAHRLELRLDGHQDFDERFEVAAGDERIFELSLAPLAEPEDREPVAPETTEPVERSLGVEMDVGTDPPVDGGRRYHRASYFWALLGVSAAMLVAGAVVGGVALSDSNEYEDLNRPTRTIEEDGRMDELESSIRSFSIAADVLLFTGAAGAVATIILAFFTDFGGERTESAARGAPTVTPGGAGLSVGGVF